METGQGLQGTLLRDIMSLGFPEIEEPKSTPQSPSNHQGPYTSAGSNNRSTPTLKAGAPP